MNQPSVVEWEIVLAELRAKGVGLQQVEERTGVDRCTLRNYSVYGNEPRHRVGEVLIALWCEVTTKQREDLPRRPYWKLTHSRS